MVAEIVGWAGFAGTVVTTLGVVVCTWLAKGSKRSADTAAHSVRPNGMGTVTEMLERQLIETGRIHERLDGIEGRLEKLERPAGAAAGPGTQPTATS